MEYESTTEKTNNLEYIQAYSKRTSAYEDFFCYTWVTIVIGAVIYGFCAMIDASINYKLERLDACVVSGESFVNCETLIRKGRQVYDD